METGAIGLSSGLIYAPGMHAAPDELATVALAALSRAGVATVASVETGTGGALLSILARCEPGSGAATFIGGLLDAGGGGGATTADAVIRVWLLPTDTHGRSRVRVSMTGRAAIDAIEVRVHGSGSQRARRAAFAALDQVRRAFP